MSRISNALLGVQVPSALVIGGDAVLLERCQRAAEEAGLAVKACPPSMAASIAAERRPLVVLVTEMAYALDGEALEAVARVADATLLPVDPCAGAPELAAALSGAARESRRRRAEHAEPGHPTASHADEEGAGPASARGGPASSRGWSPGMSAPLAGPVKAGPIRSITPPASVRIVAGPTSSR